MKSCVLLLRDRNFLNDVVSIFCEARLSVLAISYSSNVDENQLRSLQPDFILSFLNEHILRGPLLELPGINFHPAPPEYPGRGGASFALYDEVAEFGATAHLMASKVDTGPILAVRRFSVSEPDNCEVLFARAEMAAAELLFDVVDEIGRAGRLPEPDGSRWLRAPITRAEFDAWLIINPDDPDDIRRKIKAAGHSRYPGPYLTIGGHRFAYQHVRRSAPKIGSEQP